MFGVLALSRLKLPQPVFGFAYGLATHFHSGDQRPLVRYAFRALSNVALRHFQRGFAAGHCRLIIAGFSSPVLASPRQSAKRPEARQPERPNGLRGTPPHIPKRRLAWQRAPRHRTQYRSVGSIREGLRTYLPRQSCRRMAKGLKIGDEVAITAKVGRRVTEDRVSVSIPSYGQPHSIVDRTAKVKPAQEIELRGDVTRVDEDKVTINLGIPVTVNADTVRLVTPYKPPTRKTPLVDKPT
ncbi:MULTISPECIES: hypothetical protein [unclassified Mesorhizobium]|uniref:hypothetical protein n=1 Tax=unclassified Mesorhizobium TaxID=325217 RepID=UPI0032AF7B2C